MEGMANPYLIYSERTVTTQNGKTLGVRVERYRDDTHLQIRFYWINEGEARPFTRENHPENCKDGCWWNVSGAQYAVETFAANPRGIFLGAQIDSLDAETHRALAAWALSCVERIAA